VLCKSQQPSFIISSDIDQLQISLMLSSKFAINWLLKIPLHEKHYRML